MRNPLNSIINQNFKLQLTVTVLDKLASKYESVLKERMGSQNSDQIHLLAGFQLTQDIRKIIKDLGSVQKLQSASSKILKFLVSDILDFQRIKAEKFKTTMKSFNIEETI